MFTIIWVGWCTDGNSDKLWGIIEDNNQQYYNFWCRRGAKMQFKLVDNKKYSHKQKNGYHEIDQFTLNKIYPSFDEEAMHQLVFGLMSGKVRGVEYE